MTALVLLGIAALFVLGAGIFWNRDRHGAHVWLGFALVWATLALIEVTRG